MCPQHPAQLYEAIIYLLVFLLVFYLYFFKRIEINRGVYFGLSISLLFTARFFIEFFKERQVEFEEGMVLDMGANTKVPLILVAVGFLVFGLCKRPVTTSI